MIHRLALLMGGAGAAGVLALALSLNGSASPTTDAFVPVANDVTATDQLAQAATDPQAQVTDPSTDQTAPSVKKQVDTIYVLPAPKPRRNNQPSDTPRPPRNDGGGTVAGDDGQGNSADDQAGGEDEHDGGDQSDDGGHEPGDD